ncbi:MAG TPA: YggS family pyridoxal phosphate-dependent enzyme [Planctomycetota bacterium]|nr:YggS family pyridoxal phosphate-dependent enzyme [Planctomycetota bacterium]
MERSSEKIPFARIEANLKTIRDRIGQAASRASRDAAGIKLVAVTKYVGLEEMEALYKLGVEHFGESRVQDAEKKCKAFEASAPGMIWHLIGHLQTNKADKAVKLFQLVHSIDSDRVAQALHKEQAKKFGALTPPPSTTVLFPPLEGLIEVNVAGEANKHGLPPDLEQLRVLLETCASLHGIRVTGLMCMAPYAENPEPTSRPVFKRLRELRDELNSKNVYPHPLTELSMGMTQDYHIAIEEGATIVRIGSALFE